MKIFKHQNNLHSDGLYVPEMKPEFTGLSDVQWISTFQSIRPSYLLSTDFQSPSSFSVHYCLANNVIYAWDTYIKMQCSYSNCHNY